eukprot:TRINITY_DN11193_c0_g2_i1.p2 TRINITY_DN11193_c0_g2~~TRINITY_DN11193_c0_g2_i1.p2  ORF type:complete len:118 (-),score=4.55 TRINITY_DN11193_c0_g2_i1:151-504(-)
MILRGLYILYAQNGPFCGPLKNTPIKYMRTIRYTTLLVFIENFLQVLDRRGCDNQLLQLQNQKYTQKAEVNPKTPHIIAIIQKNVYRQFLKKVTRINTMHKLTTRTKMTLKNFSQRF